MSGLLDPTTRAAAERLGLTSADAAVPVVPAPFIDALVAGPALDPDRAGRRWDYDPAADDAAPQAIP